MMPLRVAPSFSIAEIVASSTPGSAPFHPAWAPPITRALGSTNSTGPQSAVETPSAMPGVLEATISAMEKLGATRSGIIAAIGPLIRQDSYEVGNEFVARFLQAGGAHA